MKEFKKIYTTYELREAAREQTTTLEELLASATNLEDEDTLHVTDILPLSVTQQALLTLTREDNDDDIFLKL